MKPLDRGQADRLDQLAGAGMDNLQTGSGGNSRHDDDHAREDREQGARVRESIATSFYGGQKHAQGSVQELCASAHDVTAACVELVLDARRRCARSAGNLPAILPRCPSRATICSEARSSTGRASWSTRFERHLEAICCVRWCARRRTRKDPAPPSELAVAGWRRVSQAGSWPMAQSIGNRPARACSNNLARVVPTAQGQVRGLRPGP